MDDYRLRREELLPEGITSPRDSSFISNAGEEDVGYDDEDYEDEYEEEDDNYENGDEDEDEEMEELIPVVTTSAMGSGSISGDMIEVATVGINDGSMDDSNALESCEGKQGNKESGMELLNGDEIDGSFCPICLEAWTSGGDHQICCLPCGHIFGSSCIKKWLQLRRGSGKCPLCNSLCKLKDVRVLYATRLCVADEESHKQELQILRAQQLEIKQSLRELQERLDQHREYVQSCLEDMRHRQPLPPP